MSQFAAFLVVGGTAAFVNIVSRYLLNVFFSYDIAIVIAYCIGITTAYTLNRAFVFTGSRLSAGQYIRFVFVNIVMLGQVWAVSVGLAEYIFPWIGFTWYPHDFAHVIGVASPAVTSFFAHKYFSFR